MDAEYNTNEKPWDQQDGESDLWYGRFTKYRLMGTKRNVNAVFKKETPRNPENSRMIADKDWYIIEKEWKWKERARAWDKHQRDEEDKIIAEEKDKVLRSGFALMHNRVKELDRLANEFKKMARDKDNVWIPETKTIVGEKETIYINKVVFNHQLFQLIDKYFDSIAKEVGDRIKKQMLDVNTKDSEQDIIAANEAIEKALEAYPEAKIALAEALVELGKVSESSS